MQTDNSSTEESSISSAFEHHNESSEDFLKIHGAGLLGLLERMPLWSKLLCITLLATIMIVSLAGWLVAVQGSIVAESLGNRKFTVEFLEIANLLKSVQDERGWAALYLNSPTLENLVHLQQGFNRTNFQLSFSKKREWFVPDSPVDRNAQQLGTIRNHVQSTQFTDPISLVLWYNNYANAFLDVITKEAKQHNAQTFVIVQELFLRVAEWLGEMRALGTVLFSSNNTALCSEYNYELFKGYVVNRNSTTDMWMLFATDEQIAMLNTKVLSIPEYAIVMGIVRQVLTGYRTNFCSSIDPSAWMSNITVVFDAFYKMLNTLLEQGDTYSYMVVADSFIHITIIGVLVVAFVVLYTLISFCFSKTIIGPWVRLNKLQEMVTYKFVPRGLLRMIGCDNIMQVQVGKHASVRIVLMKIRIRDYWDHIDSSSIENRIVYTNRFFDSINPLLSSYSGYIDTMSSEELQVCFKTPGSAVTCARKIQQQVKSLNMSDFAPLNLTIAIHAAAKADLAIVGDADRIQSVVISRVAREVRQMLSIASRFQCKIVVSNNLMDLLGPNKIDDIQLVAMCGGKSHFVIYEISSKKNKAERDQFSKAVRDVFVDHNLVDAMAFFKSNNCEASKFYTRVCTQVMDHCRAELANTTVEEVIKEPVFEEVLEQACKKEKSYENFQAFKNIKQFKEACLQRNSNAQLESVSALKRQIEFVNITDTLKQSVIKMFEEPNDWTENTFAVLESEVLVLLTDTVKRLKVSDKFRSVYIKCKGVKSTILEERFDYY